MLISMATPKIAGMTPNISRIRSSKARFAFANNSTDMAAYYSIHQHFVKTAPRKVQRLAYIFNKSMYVLVASLWEAYCEDIAAESLELLVDHVPSWKGLPQQLVKSIARELRKDDTVLLAPWELAGDGWRQYVKDRQEARSYGRNYDFSGPKSASIERFFSESLGVPAIRNVWRDREGPQVCEDLDAHLDKRNDIVHQIAPGPAVNKRDVRGFYGVVRCLVKCTDQVMDEMLTNATGKSRWVTYVKSGPVEMGDVEPEADDDDLPELSG